VQSDRSEESEDSEEYQVDIGQHARALATQATHELRTGGLISEIRSQILDSVSSPASTDSQPRFQFWATPEAKDRCLNIARKIGGASEKRRAQELFEPEGSDKGFWEGSRFSPGYLPGLPVRLLDPSGPLPASLPPFVAHLAQTCELILSGIDGREGGERDKITPHTVRSLLEGARRGWTTLTANRGSVKEILKVMRTRADSLRHDFSQLSLEDQRLEEAEGGSDGSDDRVWAAIWLVEPRSLAEGMRVDSLGVSTSEQQSHCSKRCDGCVPHAKINK